MTHTGRNRLVQLGVRWLPARTGGMLRRAGVGDQVNPAAGFPPCGIGGAKFCCGRPWLGGRLCLSGRRGPRGARPTREVTMPDRMAGQSALARPAGSRGRHVEFLPAGRPLARPRLLTALSRAVDRAPVTLVSGQPGTGKTVLAATWAHRAAGSTAVGWVTLAHDDVPVAEFWTAVLAAVAGTGTPLADVPRPVPGERLPADFVDRLAGALAAARAPVVLVVDNADHLAGELVAGLDLLMAPAADRLRLVLTASADPLRLLASYRASGALAEIRGDELAFRPAETRELMSRLGAPVTASSAAELTAATGGSPVALGLAAAELARGVPAERLLADLAGTDTPPGHHLAAGGLAVPPRGRRRLPPRGPGGPPPLAGPGPRAPRHPPRGPAP